MNDVLPNYYQIGLMWAFIGLALNISIFGLTYRCIIVMVFSYFLWPLHLLYLAFEFFSDIIKQKND